MNKKTILYIIVGIGVIALTVMKLKSNKEVLLLYRYKNGVISNEI